MIILFSMIASFLWAIVNFLDKYLIDRVVKNREVGSLIIFSGLIGVPVSLITYLFQPSVVNVTFENALFASIAGFVYLLGILFYLKALSIADASFVMPFGFLIPFFGYILGLIFLGEHLTLNGFIGALIILIGSIFLSLFGNPGSLKKVNTAVIGFMGFTSLFVSLNGFIFKFANIEGLTFWQAVFWEHIGFIFFATYLLITSKNYKSQFINLIKSNGVIVLVLNIFSEIITITGNMVFHYTTLISTLVIAQVLAEGFQPIFVLLFGLVLTFYFPKIVKEDTNLKVIMVKFMAIIMMLFGLFLIDV